MVSPVLSLAEYEVSTPHVPSRVLVRESTTDLNASIIREGKSRVISLGQYLAGLCLKRSAWEIDRP